MSQFPSPEKQIDMFAAIDQRLMTLWAVMFETAKEDLTPEVIANFMRTAFIEGYQQGMCDEVRGALWQELGYAVPKRKAA